MRNVDLSACSDDALILALEGRGYCVLGPIYDEPVSDLLAQAVAWARRGDRAEALHYLVEAVPDLYPLQRLCR